MPVAHPSQNTTSLSEALEHAIRNNAPGAVVLALLAVHPEGAKEKDENGRLPLEFAMSNNSSDAVVEALC